MAKKPVTVGPKEGLGAGIIALGILLLFLPSFSQKIADLDFISSEAFAILLGSVYVLSIFVILSGVAVIVAKFQDDEEE
jgi:putative effector of murein hydrolase LrgA (UPF0299 family)